MKKVLKPFLLLAIVIALFTSMPIAFAQTISTSQKGTTINYIDNIISDNSVSYINMSDTLQRRNLPEITSKGINGIYDQSGIPMTGQAKPAKISNQILLSEAVYNGNPATVPGSTITNINGTNYYNDYRNGSWENTLNGTGWFPTWRASFTYGQPQLIWENSFVRNPRSGDLVKFTKNFTIEGQNIATGTDAGYSSAVPSDTAAQLVLAADNAAIAFVNGHYVGKTYAVQYNDSNPTSISDDQLHLQAIFGDLSGSYINYLNWGTPKSINIPVSFLNANGQNSLVVYAANSAIDPTIYAGHIRPGDVSYNPAFLLFGMRITSSTTKETGTLELTKALIGSVGAGTITGDGATFSAAQTGNNNWFQYTTVQPLAKNSIQTFNLVSGKNIQIVGTFTLNYNATANTLTVSYNINPGITVTSGGFSIANNSKTLDSNPGYMNYAYATNGSASGGSLTISTLAQKTGTGKNMVSLPALNVNNNVYIYIHFSTNGGLMSYTKPSDINYINSNSTFTFKISGGNLASPIIKVIPAGSKADFQLDPGTYKITESIQNKNEINVTDFTNGSIVQIDANQTSSLTYQNNYLNNKVQNSPKTGDDLCPIFDPIIWIANQLGIPHLFG